MLWLREPRYLRLSGQALLDYAHKLGVWVTDFEFSPGNNRELAERLAAGAIDDAEIRKRIIARRTEIYAQFSMWAAIVAPFLSIIAVVMSTWPK